MHRSLLAVGLLVVALGSSPSPGQQKQIQNLDDALRSIKSSNSADRAAGLVALAVFGQEGKGASKEVVGLLFDSTPIVREWANKALPKVNPEIAAPVMELANGQDYEKRLEAMKKLSAMGANAGPAVPALMKFLSQAEEKDRAAVVGTMAKVGSKDPAMASTLANLGLKDKDPAVRQAALAALPNMTDPQGAMEVFNGLLKSTDPAQRGMAITGLTALAATNPQAMKELKNAAKDPSPTVSAAAKQAVDKLEKKK